MEQGRKIVGRGQAAELFAGIHVNVGTLLRVVQELIAVYPVWEELDGGNASAASIVMASAGLTASMTRGHSQTATATAAAAAAATSTPTVATAGRNNTTALQGVGAARSSSSSTINHNGSTDGLKVFQPDQGLAESEVVPFLLKMRQARLVDVGHPDDAGDSITSKTPGHADETRANKRARIN
jgi:hypothetical protein